MLRREAEGGREGMGREGERGEGGRRGEEEGGGGERKDGILIWTGSV